MTTTPTGTPNSTKPSKSSPESRRQSTRRFRRRKAGPRAPASKPAVYSITAGGIIFRRRGGIVEIFFIKDSFNRWTFPKGKQEKGENLIETAIREIKEETGLDHLTYVAQLGKTSFRFRREVGVIQKVVHYFLFQAPADAKAKFKTVEEIGPDREHISEGQWVALNKAFLVSGYKNSDHLLARAFRLIGGQNRGTQRRPRP